jgi:hypothetical protein
MKQNQDLNVSNITTSIGHNPLDPNQASSVHQESRAGEPEIAIDRIKAMSRNCIGGSNVRGIAVSLM